MQHSFDKEQKVTILLAALDERYKSTHTIRERVQNTGVWALGLLLGAGGWLIQSGVELSSQQKGIFVIFVLGAFSILRFRYLEDLHTGFKSQQSVAVRLEKSLGLFTPGVLSDDTESMYPQSWESTGKKDGNGKFFQTTYLLLYIGVTFLVLAILIASSGHHEWSHFQQFSSWQI